MSITIMIAIRKERKEKHSASLLAYRPIDPTTRGNAELGDAILNINVGGRGAGSGKFDINVRLRNVMISVNR